MCGVVGYIGTNNVNNRLVSMLEKLEYRGYDSAGVASVSGGEIVVQKFAGNVSNLKKNIKSSGDEICGIGHTRWATHGVPNDVNAHPHKSFSNLWAIVHNGIIENYSELKKEITKSTKIKFVSDTDSEVVAQLLDIYSCEDSITTLITVTKKLKGSYALACVNKEKNGRLYLAKNKSPLYVAVGSGEVFVASDPVCFVGRCQSYYCMEDNEFCEVSVNGISFYDDKHRVIDKNTCLLESTFDMAYKQNYNHFMLKEIKEIPDCLRRIVDAYSGGNFFEHITLDFLHRYDRVLFIGCGTAYNVATMGEMYFRKIAKIESSSFVASEFRYGDHIINEKTLCVLVSQSGETADTLACASLIKSCGGTTIALTNVLYSSLAKMSDFVLPVFAGPEIAVASTKAYSCQIAICYMLANHIASLFCGGKNKSFEEIKYLADNLHDPFDINLGGLVKEMVHLKECFMLGRDLDYITVTEGCLKIKEITYINSSAYPAGELKHGFLALVDRGSYVFVLATQESLLDKTLNGANESASRGGKIVLITPFDLPREKIGEFYKVIRLQKFDDYLMPIVAVHFFQMFSYLISVAKGINPDQPRNLAKSVTVE